MTWKMKVVITMASLAVLTLPSAALSQVPTVRMKGEAARERFQMIRDGLTPGGSQISAAVPAKRRLVITDLVVSADAKACNIMIRRSATSFSCAGSSDDVLVPPLCVPSTGGTVSHTFATGLEVPEGWHVCIYRGVDTGPGVAEVLVTGYFTKAKK